MGFQINKKNKGPIADINVTPLVDVMLVLLVIFMISAPLLYSGIKLNLPKTKKVNNLKLDNKKLILSINENGKLFLGKKEMLLQDIELQVINFFQKFPDEVIYLRAHDKLNYGYVANIMSHLKKAGALNISLVTEPLR